jgi:hypothetical protein
MAKAKKQKNAGVAARDVQFNRDATEEVYAKVKKSVLYMALMMASIFVFYTFYTELAPIVMRFFQ